MSNLVLVVEDEYDIADIICRFLHKEGFTTAHLDNGNTVVEFVRNTPPDIIILDLMLPGIDGVTLCKLLRQESDVPIIMVTAKVAETERLIGFDVGADDYVCKPFSALELTMRVKVHLRRSLRHQSNDGGLILDKEKLKLAYQDIQIDLTSIEFALMELLIEKPGKVFSRNYILDNIYQDYRVVSDRTVDSHIRNLRKKLKLLEQEHDFVQSVYGAGYRYVPIDS